MRAASPITPARLEQAAGAPVRPGRHALLIVLQGMDTAGKDGAINACDARRQSAGCNVVSFKTPTPSEAAHDFLWREVVALPERGQIAVFNRSYYEAVLVEPRASELLVAEGVQRERRRARRVLGGAHCTRSAISSATSTTTARASSRSSCTSPRPSRSSRLLDRLDDPEKTWKALAADAEERGYWKDYRRAYEARAVGTSAPTRRGGSCRPTTSPMRVCSFRRS